MNNRLKELRIESNLTQTEFGQRIGLDSKSHISLLESGARNITDRTIKDICREFNVNEDWFRFGTLPKYKIAGDDFTKIAASIDKGDLKARNAIIKYWSLSEDDKTLFWNWVEKFMK